jgi:hypothetical protein
MAVSGAHFQGTPGQVAPDLSHPGGGFGIAHAGSGTDAIMPLTCAILK